MKGLGCGAMLPVFGCHVVLEVLVSLLVPLLLRVADDFPGAHVVVRGRHSLAGKPHTLKAVRQKRHILV